jgi:hypothetical protein
MEDDSWSSLRRWNRLGLCGRLVGMLPAVQDDPNRPEDVLKVDEDEDGVGGDDAADALRYLVATRSGCPAFVMENAVGSGIDSGRL